MFVNNDKSNAIFLATNAYQKTVASFNVDLRWLDNDKTYLIQDITLNDNNIFSYKFVKRATGAELKSNGLTVDFNSNTSNGKAYWIQEDNNADLQVLYSDYTVGKYTESNNNGAYTINITGGTPNAKSQLVIYNRKTNTTEIKSCNLSAAGNGIINFSDSVVSTVSNPKTGNPNIIPAVLPIGVFLWWALFFCSFSSNSTAHLQWEVRTRVLGLEDMRMTDAQKEQIYELRQQGCGYSKISTLLSISKNTVKSFCQRNKLRTASQSAAPLCKQCGAPIPINKKSKSRIFCSDKCRTAWWKAHHYKTYSKSVYHLMCQYCGADFESIGNRRQKYCSHDCYIAARFGKGRDGNK